MSPKLCFLLATTTLFSCLSFAEINEPKIISVGELRQLEPGQQWNPEDHELSVRVRGYLRGSINMYLYPTMDQALLDDFNSGVRISEEGEGMLREECSESFVDLVAIVVWAEIEREVVLIPISVSKLSLHDRQPAKAQLCWKSN